MDSKTRVQVAMANLLAQGLVEQRAVGIRATQKGFEKAAKVWETIPDEDRLLLIPYLRRHLDLRYPEESMNE